MTFVANINTSKLNNRLNPMISGSSREIHESLGGSIINFKGSVDDLNKSPECRVTDVIPFQQKRDTRHLSVKTEFTPSTRDHNAVKASLVNQSDNAFSGIVNISCIAQGFSQRSVNERGRIPEYTEGNFDAYYPNLGVQVRFQNDEKASVAARSEVQINVLQEKSASIFTINPDGENYMSVFGRETVSRKTTKRVFCWVN